ncbi:uncharacterized protein LOC116300385 isoform X2 [Actinia tenebrosa]|uniref:Uncharacterized protein LOC116300385 isoform X2 n=1 Tax=Actinia tenebrosa TaxID=6105 RepID=A0A6P8IAF5_ACTTE|nr:uncharacterized protein LOC116300385 isoform X2 [Actinia tenebrosa]
MTTVRQTSRKRFPNWLRELVDKQEVNGVYWLDEEKTMFRVPWTRVDSPEFDLPRDAMLFQKWAEFTGRYHIGERTDPSVWKTRFRCAIRKMSEIEEIKIENNLDDTNGHQPFRVFRFKKEERRPKKELKRKYRCRTTSRGIATRRLNTPLVNNGKYHSTSRKIKQGVVLGHGITQSVTESVTQSVTQSLPGGNAQDTEMKVFNGLSHDFTALGVTKIDSMMAPNSIQQCVMQNRKTVHVNNYNDLRSDDVNDMAVTQSISNFRIPNGSLQKLMPGFTSSTRDVHYFPDSTLGNTSTNFERNVTQCAASNGLYRSNNMSATLINTPWSNQVGMEKGNTSQEACESDESNLPRISLQEINNILLACSEPSFTSQAGELAGVPYTTDRMMPYNALQSSFFDNGGNKTSCHNGQMLENQVCQEAKAYNDSLILNDLNEIFQQSIKIELETACLSTNNNEQESIGIHDQQDCMLPTLSNEYPSNVY